MDYLISPLTAECWPALEDLFGRAGASNRLVRAGPARAIPGTRLGPQQADLGTGIRHAASLPFACVVTGRSRRR